MSDIKKTVDGFKNITKGIGTSKDPTTNTYFQRGVKINQQQANDLYVYNWLAEKCVDIPVDDATKKWRSLLIPEPEKKIEIEEIMKEFDVKGKINLASKWARVFGGSVIIAIIDGEDPGDPLNVETIRTGSLKNFIVLDRYNVYPGPANRDIMSANFGQPEFYTVNRSGQQIHHSRLTKFEGITPTIREYEEQNYWGISIFTKLLDPITASQVVSQSINSLVYESNVDVFRIAGLNDLVAEGRDDLVVKRLRIANEMKSIINGIALDKEDEYDKKTNTFATLPEIDDRGMQKVAGASDIPVTRLLGVSPAGQNSTGESDMLNYYDNIKSIQENKLSPKVDWVDSIILASSGYKGEFKYVWNPLKQLTEEEQAEVDLKNAQRDQIYLDADVITSTDTQAELAENGTYVSIDEARVQEEKDNNELDFSEENEGDIDPAAALNGAQVTAMLEIVNKVNIGELNKVAAAELMAASFPMTTEKASGILATIIPGSIKPEDA